MSGSSFHVLRSLGTSSPEQTSDATKTSTEHRPIEDKNRNQYEVKVTEEEGKGTTVTIMPPKDQGLLIKKS